MHLTSEDQLVGIEIGGTKLQLIAADATGCIKERVRYPINAAAGAAGIRLQIQEGIEKLLQTKKVKAVGVGFGGPVNWRTGAIELSHQVAGWGNFNLQTWLQEMTNVPVAVDNDANTAALAEAKRGCGKGYNTVFYMTIGSGIGGGMVINESIYHGRTPGEVEIGHIRLDKNGNTLENNCSGWAVNEKVKEHIKRNPDSLLAQLAAKSASPAAYLLRPALEQFDKDAALMIAELADDISFALSHVVHLFNPDVMIIGGGLSLLDEHLRGPLSERLPHYLMKALLPAPAVKIAALGEDVVPIGAIELAKEAFNSSIINHKNIY